MADGCLFVSSDAEAMLKRISKRANNINVVKYLNITEKGKFRWTGSFENLEILMNELLETQTKCSSPGGHCKLLEMDTFEMGSGIQTITLFKELKLLKGSKAKSKK